MPPFYKPNFMLYIWLSNILTIKVMIELLSTLTLFLQCKFYLKEDHLTIFLLLTIKPLLNLVPSHTGIEGNKMADREANKGLNKIVSVELPPSITSLRKIIRAKALSNHELFTENDTNVSNSFKWNIQISHNRKEYKALRQQPRFIQRSISKIRIHAPSPRFIGCIHWDDEPFDNILHYLTECHTTRAQRKLLLLSHVHTSDRNEHPHTLALLILNRQTQRNYVDLAKFIRLFDFL